MKSSIEKDLLQYGLLIGVAYQFYQTIISIFPELFMRHALVNLALTLVMVFLLIVTQRRRHVQLIAFMMHMIVLCALGYFWATSGGLAGTVPSFLCVYAIFIVTTSHGAYLWFSLVMFGILGVGSIEFYELLGMKSFSEPEKVGRLQEAIDFVVVGIIMVVFVWFIKRKFMFYRGEVARKHQQLKQIASTLHNQNLELAMREEETRSINDNLEQLVNDRMREIENKNKALSEFAFINAHMLRGPLCRILGLIQLAETDVSYNYNQEHLRALKKITEEIDGEIKTINRLLS